jgi:hypothetical protein
MVLGLSVMATPVSADVTKPVVSLYSTCTGANATYNITFNTTASLTEGVHSICILFPTGTVLPSTWSSSSILLTPGGYVFPSEITVTGQKVCFKVPVDIAIGQILVTIKGIINPPAGSYTVWVNTDRAPDSKPVESAKYDVAPLYSTYKWTVDFSPTYSDLAADFVPPFKACGQVNFGNQTEQGKWFTQFNITLATDVLGCKGYDPVLINIELCKTASATANVTVYLFDGVATWYKFVVNNTSKNFTWGPPAGFNLSASYTATTPAQVHFDTPGKYEICLTLKYLGVAEPCNPIAGSIITSRTIPAAVYQWKEAFKIPMYRKWNLISLPLVPLVDPPLADVINAWADKSEIVSIWYFNQCTDKWSVYPAGTLGGDQALTTMEDGKSYFFRTKYDVAKPAGTPLKGMWVWGTMQPVPPAAPSAYPVCEGWNMIGFTKLAPITDAAYLWNFVGLYGATYRWDAPTQSYVLVTPGLMTAGTGYWTSFAAPGNILPP